MSTVMEQPGGDVTESGRGGRGMVMAGVAVGAVVLVGGGAWAATQLLASGGEQPDTVLPASSAFYARFDVDPDAGQKVAAVRFFQGLDEETKARLDQGEWREWVWQQLEEEGEIPEGLDFETDIEPWLGDRLGVAVVPRGAEEEPIVAVALQVKDGDEALATLDRLMADADADAAEAVAYYLDDDYVVFTQAETLEDLRAAAEQGTLDGHDVYTEDMDELGDAGIASMWVDASRLGDLAPGAFANPALGGAAVLGGVGGELGDEADMLTGRMAASLRLSADAIEVHGLSRGAEGLTLPAGGDTPRLVDELPADTAAAFSLENGAAWVQAAWDYYAAAYPAEVEELAAAAEEEGFTLPDDVKTVLGDSMALAVGPDVVDALETMSETSTGMPAVPVGYRVATDGAALVQMLSDAGLPPSTLAQRTDDGVLTLGLDQAYVDRIAVPESRLGQDATYRAAVADADGADSVLYVDVNAFEEYYLPTVPDEQVRSSLEALAAVGMSTTVESSDQSRFTLRFVADPE